MRSLLIFLLVLPLMAAEPPTETPAIPTAALPAKRHGDAAKLLVKRLPNEHLTRHAMDDDISSQAWSSYLDSLDRNRMYFLQSDIDAFASHELLLDDQLKKGDVSFAFTVYNVFRQHLRNRTHYIETLLATEPDFTIKETFQWKRKEAPWPKDEAERDDLWRKRIKNELLARTVQETLSKKNQDENEHKDGDKDGDESPAEAMLKGYKRYLEIVELHDADIILDRFLSSVTHAYDPHCDYMSYHAAENFDNWVCS